MILHEWEFGHRRTHREMMRRTFMFSPGQRQMHQCDLEKWLVTYLNILVSCATKLGALWSPVGWSTLRCAVVEKELCITPLTVLMGVDYQGISIFGWTWWLTVEHVPGPSGGDPEEAEGEEGHDERCEEVPEGYGGHCLCDWYALLYMKQVILNFLRQKCINYRV